MHGKWAGDLTNLVQSDCYDATRFKTTSMVFFFGSQEFNGINTYHLQDDL